MRLLLCSGFAQGHEEIIERCPLLSLHAYTQQLEPLTRPLFVRAASKLTEAEIQKNFVILLHCFHFLTKRSFVYTPSPEAEPVNIGRTKNKDRTKDKWDTIPSSGTACASS